MKEETINIKKCLICIGHPTAPSTYERDAVAERQVAKKLSVEKRQRA